MTKKYTLADLTLNITDGKHGDCKNEDNSGYYFISVKDLDYFEIDYLNARQITKSDFIETHKRTKLDIGDTLLANSGHTIGKMLFVKETPLVSKTTFQKSVAILKPNRNLINEKYFYYSILVNKKGLRKTAVGSAQPNLLLNDLRNFKIDVFEDIQYQIKIANVLSVLDEKIELNIKTNKELESLAKLLYYYWFIQFDFPNELGNPYKASGGKMVYSFALKKEIPFLWKVDNISTRLKIGSGYPFDSSDYTENGIHKIITIKNVQDGKLDTAKIDKINYEPEKLPKFCKLVQGDVLMSLTGNVGRMCLVDEDGLFLNQRVGKLLAKENFKYFAYLFFSRPENQKKLIQIAGGSSQSNLSPIDAVNVFFAMPEEKIIEEFSTTINPIFERIIKNNVENKKLIELRDWLLPMLMTGQITVGEAEEKLNMAAEPSGVYKTKGNG